MKILFLNGGAKTTGATAALLEMVRQSASEKGHDCRTLHLGGMQLDFCRGCKRCYKTGECFQQDDDVPKVWDAFQWADSIVIGIPSYWGDMPGQMKVFVDRCTSVCDTNAARKDFCAGKTGYGLALRAGRSEEECQRLIERIEHFFGHLGIGMAGSGYFCGIETEADMRARAAEVQILCRDWF